MLMKKEVIEDNETLKKEVQDLKKQLEEEKKAYNRMYNMYVEKDNIINELEKFLIEEIEDYDKNINSRFITDITLLQYEGEKVCFEDMLGKLQELKGEDKNENM